MLLFNICNFLLALNSALRQYKSPLPRICLPPSHYSKIQENQLDKDLRRDRVLFNSCVYQDLTSLHEEFLSPSKCVQSVDNFIGDASSSNYSTPSRFTTPNLPPRIQHLFQRRGTLPHPPRHHQHIESLRPDIREELQRQLEQLHLCNSIESMRQASNTCPHEPGQNPNHNPNPLMESKEINDWLSWCESVILQAAVRTVSGGDSYTKLHDLFIPSTCSPVILVPNSSYTSPIHIKIQSTPLESEQNTDSEVIHTHLPYLWAEVVTSQQFLIKPLPGVFFPMPTMQEVLQKVSELGVHGEPSIEATEQKTDCEYESHIDALDPDRLENLSLVELDAVIHEWIPLLCADTNNKEIANSSVCHFDVYRGNESEKSSQNGASIPENIDSEVFLTIFEESQDTPSTTPSFKDSEKFERKDLLSVAEIPFPETQDPQTLDTLDAKILSSNSIFELKFVSGDTNTPRSEIDPNQNYDCSSKQDTKSMDFSTLFDAASKSTPFRTLAIHYTLPRDFIALGIDYVNY